MFLVGCGAAAGDAPKVDAELKSVSAEAKEKDAQQTLPPGEGPGN
jgi:hypothetical protein